MIARFTLSVACVLVAACGADGAETGAHMADGRLLSAEGGTLSARFEMESPRKGNNSLTIELYRAEGAPLHGAAVRVSPWMPAHGHGSADTAAAEVDEGVYRAPEVYFNMTGGWELHVAVSAAAVDDDFVVAVQVR